MQENYEKLILTITRFSDEDVITTSSDRNNAYRELSELDGSGGRMPNVPSGF